MKVGAYRKKLPAYFTVEAAMVFPIVFYVVIIIIYMMFFQYNQCLLEQDVGALALRGVTMQEENKNVLLKRLQREAQEADTTKYVAWEIGEMTVKLEGNTIRISQSGGLKFPFRGVGIDGKESWYMQIAYENEITDPATCIRSWKRLVGGD